MNPVKALQVLKDAKFDIGDEVEFAIKSGKDSGLVQHLILCPNTILYEVIWSDKSTDKHYDFELLKKGGDK